MLRKTTRCCLVMVCVLAVLGGRANSAKGYFIETVFSGGSEINFGRISTAVDSAGQPHVLFISTTDADPRTDIVTYATRTDQGWVSETVSTGTIRSARHSLALDAQGRPHLALFDVTTNDIFYGARNGSGWVFEPVASGAHALAPVIGVDSTGTPHIAYGVTTGGLIGSPRLATRESQNQWGVAPNLLPNRILFDGEPLDIVFDHSDRPYINYASRTSFNAPNSVVVASTDSALGGALTIQSEIMFPEDVPKQTDLVIDNDNTLRMMLRLDTSRGPRVDQYIDTPGGWETELSLSEGRTFFTPASMTVDSQNRSQILRVRRRPATGFSALELHTISGGLVTVESIAPGLDTETVSPGGSISIAAGDDGGLHLLYDGHNGLQYLFIPEPLTSVWIGLAGLAAVCKRP